MKTFFSLLLLWIASASATFVINEGVCPDVQAQPTLKIERYLGIWYEFMRFPAVFEAGRECTSALYRALPNNTISVRNEGYLRAAVFGRNYVLDRSVAQGFAEMPDPTKPAELKVSFPPSFSNSVNYKIIDTDYDNYAVVFSCQEIWTANIQFAWILTRERGVAPSNARLGLIQRRFRLDGVDVSNFHRVNQRDCPPVGA